MVFDMNGHDKGIAIVIVGIFFVVVVGDIVVNNDFLTRHHNRFNIVS